MPKPQLLSGPHLFLAKGDFKLSLLMMLKERRMYGYEVMQAFEERFHGFYKPSAGAVYPALRSLLRNGLVTVSGAGRRKIYRITPLGKKLLQSRMAEFKRRMEEFEKSIGPERAALMREIRTTGKLLASNLRVVTPEQAEQLRDLVAKMRRNMMEVVSRQKVCE